MLKGVPASMRLTTYCLLMAGCSGTPAGIAPPKLDPAGSAARAISQYDSNGDGQLSKEELQECPGLLSSIDHFDQNGDGLISASELEAKLRDIEKQGAGLVEIHYVVRRSGHPLEGASVKLEPEVFLAGAIKPATGITGQDGTAFPSVADEELPSEYRGRLHGANCGVYRVIVTHPGFEVPAKFNTHTKIGRIVTRRDHETLTIEL